MIIPQWMISGFAVFGFVCLWCICAAVFGLIVGKCLDEMAEG